MIIEKVMNVYLRVEFPKQQKRVRVSEITEIGIIGTAAIDKETNEIRRNKYSGRKYSNNCSVSF